ncbi:hypothetical protein, partial [Burkholderia anthina]|uniref:hypothetical protein n=1 Tax=Burkholderia anthina TaxID=179879 RepID=UPI00158F4862
MKIISKRPASSLAPRPGGRHRCTRRDTAVVAVLLALRPAGDSWLGMARCLADCPALPLIVTGTCDERTRRAAMRLARARGVSV